MSSTSMPGPSVGSAAISKNGPQHAQLQQHPAVNGTSSSSAADTTNKNNTHNNNNEHADATQQVTMPERHWSLMTRTIAHYERLEQIGEGTYGQVYKARCKDTNQIVAMKKIRVHHGKDWGMPPTVIREIKILKRLKHPNLVRMMEVVSSKGVEHLDEEDESTDVRFQKKQKDRVVDAREGYKGNLFLVLEYVSHDLTGLMDIAYQFTPVQIKSIFKQLLEALDFMHQNKYVHRDIKSSNILLDHHFRIKLADFGLARCIEPPILDNLHDRASSQEFTNKVITLWYRPPEILLGATKYGTPVDVWSAGCILAELLLGKPLFTGKTEMDQLQLIFDLIGTPSPESWDGLTDLKLLRTGQVTLPEEDKRKQPRLRAKYSRKIEAPALSLLEKLLELDPAKRLSAERALTNRYFLMEPRAPDRPEDLGPVQVSSHFHEFQTKRKRRQAKAEAEKARGVAKDAGMDDDQAQEQFDTCYRKLMARVAAEGIDAFGAPSASKRKERDSSTSSDKRKDKHKDRDRDRDSAGDERRENKNSARLSRDRADDDRRRKERDPESSSKRDGDRRKDDDDERRRRRREQDGRGSKERRPPLNDDERGDGDKREPRKDRDRPSRERRSSKDRDRDRGRDDKGSRRRDSDRDDSRSKKRRRREEGDERKSRRRNAGGIDGEIKTAPAMPPNMEQSGSGEGAVERRPRDDARDRDFRSHDRGSRERDRYGRGDWPPNDMPRRDGSDRRDEARYDDRREYDNKRFGNDTRHDHMRGDFPDHWGPRPGWGGPGPGDFPPGRRGGPPPPGGLYGPGGPPFPRGGPPPPFRDGRDGGPPRGNRDSTQPFRDGRDGGPRGNRDRRSPGRGRRGGGKDRS